MLDPGSLAPDQARKTPTHLEIQAQRHSQLEHRATTRWCSTPAGAGQTEAIIPVRAPNGQGLLGGDCFINLAIMKPPTLGLCE